MSSNSPYDSARHKTAVVAFARAATSANPEQVTQVAIKDAVLAARNSNALVEHLNEVLGDESGWLAVRARRGLAATPTGTALLIAFVPRDTCRQITELDEPIFGARLFALAWYGGRSNGAQLVPMVGEGHQRRQRELFGEMTLANVERLLPELVGVLETYIPQLPTGEPRYQVYNLVLTELKQLVAAMRRGELSSHDLDRAVGLALRLSLVAEHPASHTLTAAETQVPRGK